MSREILTNRQLNRATLARQMLLERSDMSIADAVRFLGGLQAQQSNDPYIGLWSRLNGFTHEALTAMIVDKTLLRATTMRGTLHLHTAEDLVGFRALVQDFLTGVWRSRDRWRGLLTGLLKWELDWLSDHSITHYARHLCAAADQEDGGAEALPQRVSRRAA